jgi:hypothetical protein
MATLDVTASSLMKRITMTVRVSGVMRQHARIWLGCQLIKIAARVMGVGIQIDHD